MQYHQLRKLVQALQVSCHLYPLLRLWSLLADSEKKRIQAFETKCLRKHPRISHLEHKTNDWVRSKINFRVGPQEPLLATDKRWKLAWFGHVTRHDSLSKTILRGTLEAGRCRVRQRKCWMDNIKEWTSLPMPELLTRASCRKDRKRISAELSIMSPRRLNRSSSLMSPRRPNRSRDWTEQNWTVLRRSTSFGLIRLDLLLRSLHLARRPSATQSDLPSNLSL